MNSRDRVKEVIQCHVGFAGSGDAADVLDEEFVIIPREDLPDFRVIDRKGEYHVDCGSDWGTWNVKHVAAMKKTALEYVGAWLTARQWHAEEAERESAAKAHAIKARRDELAREIAGEAENDPDCRVNYAGMVATSRIAIDRIIELEGKAA